MNGAIHGSLTAGLQVADNKETAQVYHAKRAGNRYWSVGRTSSESINSTSVSVGPF